MKQLMKNKKLLLTKTICQLGFRVRTTKFVARNNGIGVRQERSPQSPTAYSSVRYWQC
jgi:hypothetical protein